MSIINKIKSLFFDMAKKSYIANDTYPDLSNYVEKDNIKRFHCWLPVDIVFIDLQHIYGEPACSFLNRTDDCFIFTPDNLNQVFYPDLDALSHLPKGEYEACLKSLPPEYAILFKEDRPHVR